MNLILLFPEDIIPGTSRAILKGRRQKHVLSVHRARPGDTLIVGLEGGMIGEGRVLRLTSAELEMEVVFTIPPPPKTPIILAVALMRPPVLKRVLQTAAAMGVEAIHLFHSRRVEKSFWQSSALHPDQIKEQLVLGLEQARDTVLPEVALHPRFKPFVEDAFPVLVKGRQGILADPCPEPLGRVAAGPKVLVIGPEGGFIPYEIAAFRQAGCRPAGLGPRILRVENAVAAFLALLA